MERAFYRYRRDGLGFLRGRQVVIDPTALLREQSAFCMEAFAGLGSGVRWTVPENFREQMINILDGAEFQSVFTTEVKKNVLPDAIGWLSRLSLAHRGGSCSCYDLFTSLSGRKVFVTGNQTEALRHIFSGEKGHVLLVADENLYFVHSWRYFWFRRRCRMLKSKQHMSIPDYSHEPYLVDCRHTRYPFDDILCDTGGEGLVFETGNQVIKAYCAEVPAYVPEKLEVLRKVAKLGSHFAAPKEVLYLPSGEFVGFLMDRASFRGALDDFLCQYRVPPAIRWQIAVNFLSQVLLLHMHDVLPGDYNCNNFGVSPEGITEEADGQIIEKRFSVVFLDVDSYVVGKYGAQVQSPLPAPVERDETSKMNFIESDYLYLHGMVFFILTNGKWPFSTAEPRRPSAYILRTGRAGIPYQRYFPQQLADYFQSVLGDQQFGDPFALYHLLMSNRKFYQKLRDEDIQP